MQIQVKINETGILKNQRHAFTDRFTLITELLQNARRAGASRVTVSYDHAQQLLRVADDGQGIDDFQKLLTFHESGWGETLAAQEFPFGIGFSKCLYAATRCIVTSGDFRVDIDTESALNRIPIDVQASPTRSAGTEIELHGVDLTGIESRIDGLCLGFPTEVTFNGRDIPRPLALANLAADRTPVGAIYLCGKTDGRCTTQTIYFLQGLCVSRPSYMDLNAINVVHLESSQFMARLPDRDQLIDEDQQLQRVGCEIKSAWHRHLQFAKAQLSSKEFVSRFYDAMRNFGALELMNDVDVLPHQLVLQITGYPIQADETEGGFLAEVSDAPSRKAVESGEVKLVTLDSINSENAARWMLAWRLGYLVIRSYGLDLDHWVHAYVQDMDELDLVVEPINPASQTTMYGRWVWPQITLCDSVRISVGTASVDIYDAGVCHTGDIYIPTEEKSGEPVRQLSSFTDDRDRFELDAMEADRAELETLIRRLRCVNPVDTLDSLLQDLALENYPSLHGKSFEVSIDLPSSKVQKKVASTQAVEPAHRVRLIAVAGSSEATMDESSVVLEVRHAIS